MEKSMFEQLGIAEELRDLCSLYGERSEGGRKEEIALAHALAKEVASYECKNVEAIEELYFEKDLDQTVDVLISILSDYTGLSQSELRKKFATTT